MGESAPRRGPAGGWQCSLPGDSQWQPRPHPPLPKQSWAPCTATPGQNRPPALQRSDRGARRTQSGREGGCGVPGW